MAKIAIDCTHFIKGKAGGFEAYLLNLLDGLLSIDNLNITLYVLSGQQLSFVKYRRIFSVKPISVTNLYQRIAWQNMLLPFISIKYDVILFPANFRPLLLFCRSVTVIHDLQYIYYPEYWSFPRLLYRRAFIPYSIKISGKVITISETIKREIAKNFKRKDAIVIYNAIKRKRKSDEIATGIDIPQRFLLIPSALGPHKNLPNLVRAIDHLPIIDDSPYFVFVGAYESKDFPAKFESDRILVLGYVDITILESLYSRCIAVILPSVYEGFGMPYAEALFANKPIVASDIPIAREILNENAEFIQAPFDDVQIQKALRRVLDGSSTIPLPSDIDSLKTRTDPIEVARQYVGVLELEDL